MPAAVTLWWVGSGRPHGGRLPSPSRKGGRQRGQRVAEQYDAYQTLTADTPNGSNSPGGLAAPADTHLLARCVEPERPGQSCWRSNDPTIPLPVEPTPIQAVRVSTEIDAPQSKVGDLQPLSLVSINASTVISDPKDAQLVGVPLQVFTCNP